MCCKADIKKKLLVLDIDGTLTNSKKEIMPATKSAVINLLKQGHFCMLASGRPLHGMEWAAKELEFDKYSGYLLSYNGAKIVRFDTMETIYEKRVSKEYLCDIYQFAKENECGLISYEDNSIISGNGINEYIELEARINDLDIKEVDNFPEYFKEDVVKCLLCADPDRTEELEQKLYASIGDKVGVYRSEAFYVEAMPLGVDKATSIAHILPFIGITREDCIACGDSYNDISMIKFAGVGVAMGNAKQVVKDVADIITTSNEEEGLIPIIKKFFLENDA